MVEHQLPKLDRRVRFPLSALHEKSGDRLKIGFQAFLLDCRWRLQYVILLV